MHSQSRQRRVRVAVRSALVAAALVAAAGFGQPAHAIRFWGNEESPQADQETAAGGRPPPRTRPGGRGSRQRRLAAQLRRSRRAAAPGGGEHLDRRHR